MRYNRRFMTVTRHLAKAQRLSGSEVITNKVNFAGELDSHHPLFIKSSYGNETTHRMSSLTI